jgi:hypothetical protein
MKVERCPHCKSMAMFAVDHCSRCRKHRSTGAIMPPAEMRSLLGDARKLALMKTEHEQAKSDQESRLKYIAIFSLIVGGISIFSGLAQEMADALVGGILFLVCGLLVKIRIGVKLVALALMLMSVLEIWGRLLNFGPLVRAAGPAALAAAPMWLGGVALFVGIIAMSFKAVIHDPKKNSLPPPVPMPVSAPAFGTPPPTAEHSGDKS